MNKIIKILIISLLLISLNGCGNDVSESDFTSFAKKCEATEFYESCNELTENAEKQFFCDFKIEILIFYTYTMVEKCQFDSNSFTQFRTDLNSEFNTELITDDYAINGCDYEIYLVKYDMSVSAFGEFHKFGFVAINEEICCADFYWFYNQDYDLSITDEDSFDDFFKTEFKWFIK